MLGTHVEAGVTGAKRQSWRKGNPRDVLARLITDNPEASESEITDLMWQIVRHNTEQLGTIFEYWFANNYRSLKAKANPSGPTKTSAETEERKAETEERKAETAAATAAAVSKISEQIEEKIAEKVESRVRIVLLAMVLPTGKTVRESTREELAELGGWTQRVAEHMRPGQTVGEAGLSEDQLRALYDEG